jgi:hypothetical protein
MGLDLEELRTLRSLRSALQHFIDREEEEGDEDLFGDDALGDGGRDDDPPSSDR